MTGLFLQGWMSTALDESRPYLSGNDAAKILLLKIDEQTLYLLEKGQVLKSYTVSTSKFGIGNRTGSYQTPLGIHRVADKIGADCKPGEIIRARVPTGKIASMSDAHAPDSKDMITTRVLWLQGLQDGINRGEGIDTYQRYIYIHGTPEEKFLGRPVSIGCIRMGNAEVIELFDEVPVGTVVNIID